MKTHEVAVATMTLARDDDERTRLIDALRALSHCGLPVFVTDGGSGQAFADELAALGNFTLCETCGEGLWPQVRRSLRAAVASGARYVLYTEPDKHDFVRSSLARFIADAGADEENGIVLASRTQTDLATFPAFQQYTESVINRCCAEVIGQPLDYSYGPFLLNARIVPYLEALDPDIAWGWRPYAFGIAHRLGLRVGQAPAGRACPEDQRQDDEHTYRMLQLAQSVRGIVLSTRAKLETISA